MADEHNNRAQPMSSVTNSTIELGIEIDCTDSTSVTFESVGLYDGVFRFVTGNTTNYEGKTWGSGLIVEGSINSASRNIDISETGGYSPDGDFGFSIIGSTDIIAYVREYNINMIGRTVRVIAILDGVAIGIWYGVVDTYGESETACDFACSINFKSRHKTIPPSTTTEGEVVPVVFGRVDKSPCAKQVGVIERIGDGFGYIIDKTTTGDYGVKFTTMFYTATAYEVLRRWIEAQETGKNIYIKIESGLISEVWQDADDIYKIVSITDATLYGETLSMKIEIFAVIGDPVYAVPESSYKYTDQWTVGVYAFDSSVAVSEDVVGEYTLSSSGGPKTYSYSNDEYRDDSILVNDFTNKSIDMKGFYSTADAVGISFVNLRESEGPLSTGNTRELSNAAWWADNYGEYCDGGQPWSVSGTPANIVDRDKNTGYFLTSTFRQNSGSSYWSAVFSDLSNRMRLGHITKDDLIEGTAEYYFACDVEMISLPVSSTWNEFTFAGATDVILEIHAIPSWNTSLRYIHQSKQGQDSWENPNRVMHIPQDYYTSGLTPSYPDDKSPTTTTNQKAIWSIPSAMIDDLKNGILDRIEFVHNAAKIYWKFASNPNNLQRCIIGYIGACVLVKHNVARDDQQFFVDILSGEKSTTYTTSDVQGALGIMLEKYDGMTNDQYDLSDVGTSRADWHVGRTLTEQKSSSEYIDELCKNAFIIGFVDKLGVLKFRAWLSQVTPVYDFTEDNITRDSFVDWSYSPIDAIYNDIEANYNLDYATDKLKSVVKITNIDKSEFPAIDGDWQTYVIGQPDYYIAKTAWENARAGYVATDFIQKLPSSIGELPWYRDIYPDSIQPAWKFAELCALYLSQQKYHATISHAITSDAIDLELGDYVSITDSIHTDGIKKYGWIDNIEVDFEDKQISFGITFAPEGAEDSYIYETGDAPDTITETGSQPDTITEGA
jgi:hypothetical protein